MTNEPETRINVADAKRVFSDLLGRVAYGGESIVITRRGKPMAWLVPPGRTDTSRRLGDVEGWLDGDDPYFTIVDEIVAARPNHRPRTLGNTSQRRSRT